MCSPTGIAPEFVLARAPLRTEQLRCRSGRARTRSALFDVTRRLQLMPVMLKKRPIEPTRRQFGEV